MHEAVNLLPGLMAMKKGKSGSFQQLAFLYMMISPSIRNMPGLHARHQMDDVAHVLGQQQSDIPAQIRSWESHATSC